MSGVDTLVVELSRDLYIYHYGVSRTSGWIDGRTTQSNDQVWVTRCEVPVGHLWRDARYLLATCRKRSSCWPAFPHSETNWKLYIANSYVLQRQIIYTLFPLVLFGVARALVTSQRILVAMLNVLKQTSTLQFHCFECSDRLLINFISNQQMQYTFFQWFQWNNWKKV